jgi:hypothetical protein
MLYFVVIENETIAIYTYLSLCINKTIILFLLPQQGHWPSSS